MKIKELSGTNLIAVEVPIEIEDFRFYTYTSCGIWIGEYDGKKLNGWKVFFAKRGEYDLLGTVTKDKIGFDVEPYVDKYNDNSYRDYQVTKSFYPDSDTIDIYLTKSLSFYSMLEANGLTDFEKLLIIEKK